jgi:hypothetical protein
MEKLLQAQTERNDALEQRMRHLEAVLTSIGVSYASPGAQQSPPPNGGSTSSVSSASASMINSVNCLFLINVMDLICINSNFLMFSLLAVNATMIGLLSPIGRQLSQHSPVGTPLSATPSLAQQSPVGEYTPGTGTRDPQEGRP